MQMEAPNGLSNAANMYQDGYCTTSAVMTAMED